MREILLALYVLIFALSAVGSVAYLLVTTIRMLRE